MMPASRPRILVALIGGAIGATTLTLIHQVARRRVPEAPRVDLIGDRLVARGLEAIGVDPPTGDDLETAALAGDLVSNALYYALAGLGPPSGAIARGLALGVVGGLGSVILPPLLGLGRRETSGTPARTAMTVAWYTAGGLAAGLAIERLGRR